MNKTAVITLYKRELLDILRDKKTVFMNVFVPIILIPLITIGASQVMMSVQSSLGTQEYHIAIFGEKEARDELKQLVENTNPDQEQLSAASQNSVSISSDSHLFAKVIESDDPSQALKDKVIDAYLEVEKNGEQFHYNIHYISSNVNSSSIASDLAERLESYKQQLNMQKLESLGIDYQALQDEMRIEQQDHATKEQSIGNVLGGIIPLLLILGLVNGATHTAIDTTAGEKERGTLETTFSFPVTRREIITSKFGAVATMASFSVLLNFLSIGVMGLYTSSLIRTVTGGAPLAINLASYLPVLLILLLCVLLFAVFISAFSLAIFSVAQTPKEANLYAMPIVLIATLISYVGLIPNAELTIKTALLPVVNIVLLTKSIFVFEYDITLILVTLMSNLLYGTLAIRLMFLVFEREDILFGEDSRFLRILERRANIKRGDTPSIGEALFLLILGILGLVFIGSYFQLQFGFFGILSIQIWILLLSVGYSIYAKFDWRKVFSIQKPRLLHLLGATSLWLGTLMVVALLSLILQKYFPESVEGLEIMEEMLKEQTLPALILVIAIAPAICEELFFRGFVYSAFGKKLNPFLAILIVSAMFGIYHLPFYLFS